MKLKPYSGRVVVEREKYESLLPEHLQKDTLVPCRIIGSPTQGESPEEGSSVLIPVNALKEVRLSDEVFYMCMIRDIYAEITNTNT